jgi:hypothetical protein
MRLGRSEVPESNGDAAGGPPAFIATTRNCGWRLPDAYPAETATASKIAKVLISLARHSE